MKKVLVTGGTGFIGQYSLSLLLHQGYEVHAVSSRPITSHDQTNIHWHQADLLVSQEISKIMDKVKPTHLLHFAWYAVPGKYWTSEKNLHWVQASLHLMQRFAECGGQRIVMAGTCAEYDWQYGYCSEKVTPLAPNTLYGTCKHSLQRISSAFSKQAEISMAWGRIFFLFGPHEYPNRLVASVIRSLLKEEPARCSHGNQIRDFLYVEDVADAFVALLESDVTGPVNIASGKAITLRDIIYKIAEIQNRPELIRLGALSTSPDEPPLLVADARRLQEEVGWQPQHDLESGLKKSIAWWSQNLS